MKEITSERMRQAGSFLDQTIWSDAELDLALECLLLVIAFMEGASYNDRRIIGPLRLDLQMFERMKRAREPTDPEDIDLT